MIKDNFTRDFFQANFPVEENAFKKSRKDFENNIWGVKDLPFVELKCQFDHKETYEMLLDNSEKYFIDPPPGEQAREMEKKDKGNFWFYSAHTHGWKQLAVLGKIFDSKRFINDNSDNERYEKFRKSLWKPNPTFGNFLVKQLTKIGCAFTRITINCFSPGGYVRPHIDAPSKKPLTYAWMPLHNFDTCLKIWPYGFMKHTYGNMYLLNNSNFVHAAYNKENYNRYVALIAIDDQKCSTAFNNFVLNSAISQWCK